MDLYLNENYIRIEAKTVPEKVYLKKLFDYKKQLLLITMRNTVKFI